MSLKLYSDIYPPEIKPVREGWYAIPADAAQPDTTMWFWSYWKAGVWFYGPVGSSRPTQNVYWRGLAFDLAAGFEIDNWVWPNFPSLDDGGMKSGVFIPGAEVE